MERNGHEFDSPSLLSLISTGNLVAHEIFYHASCYSSMQYKSGKAKHDRSSTECKKAEALDRVVSYIIEHEEFNPGPLYVVKDIIKST